jgi:hypothetical protein
MNETRFKDKNDRKIDIHAMLVYIIKNFTILEIVDIFVKALNLAIEGVLNTYEYHLVGIISL